MNADDLLKDVMDTTESMYIAAMQSEWEDLDALQKMQASLVGRVVFDSEAGFNGELLKRVSELTHLVIDIAEAHRLNLYEELKTLKKNGSAQNAYLRNSDK